MTLPRSYKHTPLDEVMPAWSFGVIYAFPCHESERERCLQILQKGYTELLRLWPYLAGSVVHDHFPERRPGHLSLVLPEDDVPDIELAVLDLSGPSSSWDHDYAEVIDAGLPPRWLDATLFAPYAAGIAETTKPFLSQVNWIPGGCLLTISVLHAVMDASGMNMVIQTWARLCREMQLPETHGVTTDKMTENLVTTPIASHIPLSCKSFDDLGIRPELWKLLGLHREATLALTPPPGGFDKPTTMPAARQGLPDMRTAIFSISKYASARLKAEATPTANQQWISTSDAITALLWRSVMRARFPDDQGPAPEDINPGMDHPKSIMNVPLNGRSLFTPQLPPSHINNVIYCCINELPLHMVIGPEEPLATLACTIRGGIETIKSDATLAQDAYTLAALLPDVRKLIPAFADILGRNFVTSSWVDFPLYDVDFGPVLGKPDLIRLPRYQWFGIHIIGPRKRNGDVELFVCLKGDEMDRLISDVTFQDYATFVTE